MLRRLFIAFIEKKYPVKEAITDSEKQALYKLRFTIYKSELNKSNINNSIEQNKHIQDTEDNNESTRLYYINCPKTKKPIATFRLQQFNSNSASDTLNKHYAINAYHCLSNKQLIDISRFMIHKKSRKSLLVVSMAIFIYKYCMKHHIDAGFLHCAPGLAKRYQLFGYRRYRATLIHSNDGVRLPMINIFTDKAYYKAMKSPLLPLVIDYSAQKSSTFLLDCQNEQLFTDDSSSISALMANPKAQSLLQDLSADDIQLLLENGLIVHLEKHVRVLAEGLVEKELYMLLSGNLEVKRNDRVLAHLSDGDLFGEMAFLSDSGKRQATVYTTSPCTLFMLSRNFIQRLSTEHKDLSIKLLLNIASQLGEKLKRSNKRI